MARLQAQARHALLTARDAAEFTWWRRQFATRFGRGELPRPGMALVGRRFRLVDVGIETQQEIARGRQRAVEWRSASRAPS